MRLLVRRSRLGNVAFNLGFIPERVVATSAPPHSPIACPIGPRGAVLSRLFSHADDRRAEALPGRSPTRGRRTGSESRSEPVFPPCCLLFFFFIDSWQRRGAIGASHVSLVWLVAQPGPSARSHAAEPLEQIQLRGRPCRCAWWVLRVLGRQLTTWYWDSPRPYIGSRRELRLLSVCFANTARRDCECCIISPAASRCSLLERSLPR